MNKLDYINNKLEFFYVYVGYWYRVNNKKTQTTWTYVVLVSMPLYNKDLKNEFI